MAGPHRLLVSGAGHLSRRLGRSGLAEQADARNGNPGDGALNGSDDGKLPPPGGEPQIAPSGRTPGDRTCLQVDRGALGGVGARVG